MKKIGAIIFLYFFCCNATNTCIAQKNISGIWEGKFLQDQFDLGSPDLVVEIYDFKDSIFKGITHLYYEGNFYEHYKMLGMYDKKTNILVFKEIETIAVDLGKYGNCLGKYVTILSNTTTSMLQTGYWVSNIKYCSPTSTVWLKKRLPVQTPVTRKKEITKPKNKTIIPKPENGKKLEQKKFEPIVLEESKKLQPNITIKKNTPLPKIITQRETDVQSLIEISSKEKDSIKVDLYDNGEIDGDSISLYQDGQQLINKKLITAKPLAIYVSLDKTTNPISHLRLVAENLGTIPPCTALMIVTTKTKRYEVRLSSTFKKNASVELFLKD